MIKNIYRDGLDDNIIQAAVLHPKLAVLKAITEQDLQAASTKSSIILTGAQAERTVGLLLFQLVQAGTEFANEWTAKPGDYFLISHLAGDRIIKYVFVEAADVLMKYDQASLEQPAEPEQPAPGLERLRALGINV